MIIYGNYRRNTETFPYWKIWNICLNNRISFADSHDTFWTSPFQVFVVSAFAYRNFCIQGKQWRPFSEAVFIGHVRLHLICLFGHSKIYCNHPKSWTRWRFLRVMHPKDAEGIANSVDPDETAALGAVWSGSALFAQTCLSKNFGKLWCTYKHMSHSLLIIL